MAATITSEMTIGQVIETYPETVKVFQKHFGHGCFTCPGSRMESIAFGAMMHGLDADRIVAELNQELADAGS